MAVVNNIGIIDTPGDPAIIYTYLNEDGTFDHELYKKTQIEYGSKKFGNVWVKEENMAYLGDKLKTWLGKDIEQGLCHGTRRGKEQEWLQKYTGAVVVGTEINPQAENIANTIVWDFHDTKPEWIGAIDFIYSNSIDHSHDPAACLRTWMSCLKPSGLLILEHSRDHSVEFASKRDPFGAEIPSFLYLIMLWSRGEFGIRYMLETPKKKSHHTYNYFIVIGRN